jgi:hypothetical protein
MFPKRAKNNVGFSLVAALLLGPMMFSQAAASSPWLTQLLSEQAGAESPYTERMETDRHDFTQSSRTVGRGVIQTEMGYSFFYKDTEHELERSQTTPELLVRIGLTERLEIRTRWNYAWQDVQSEEGQEEFDAAEDLRLSLKYELCEGGGWVPESAIRIGATAPTGGGEYTAGSVCPSVDYIFTYEPVENVFFSGSAGMAMNGAGEFSIVASGGEDRGNFPVWFQSLAVGLPVTEKSEFYFEWFGIFSHDAPDEFSLSYLNIGVDYYLGPNAVLDLRVGKGLTTDSDDFFAGIGGGLRF